MIDANLNRASEGLRVLEDIARFLLNDAVLSLRLKSIRHNLIEETKLLSIELLSQRDSEHDVGGSAEDVIARGSEQNEGALKQSYQNVADLVTANAKRVEESLRVIEETARLPDLTSILDSAKLERLRFTLYTLEQSLLSKVLRRDKIKRLYGLYAILDRQALLGRDEMEVTRKIIQGGARIIQLRDKRGNKRELLSIAQKLKDLCAKSGVLFLINDYLDLALVVDADGIHIGQDDLPLPFIRRELPIDKIVGCSVTTAAQAIEAQNEGADYIAVGSIFPTPTKPGVMAVGIDRLREIKDTISCPLVAIGGININNVADVITAGADSVAVISAILGKEAVKEAVEQLISKIELTNEKCQNQ